MSISASAAAGQNVSTVTIPLVVSDTAANVLLYLDSLQTLAAASKLASVAITGPAVLTMTAARLISDAAALLKITGAYTITISGTATAAQVTGANATLTAKLTAGFALSDSSSNIANNLDALQAVIITIASIVLTDSTPVLSMTATQLVNDSSTLLKISGVYTIALSGSVTAAQAVAVKNGLIAKLTATMAVSDTAANVAANIAGLQAHAGYIASIALTGPSVLTLTAAQIVADATALLKVTGVYTIALSGTATAAQVTGANATLAAKVAGGFAVSDSAVNVSSSVDTLEAHLSTIASIVLTDTTPVLTMTATQLVNDVTVLLKITGGYTITVSGSATAAQAAAVRNSLVTKLTSGLVVSDTSANVTASIAGLQAHANYIASITLSDVSTLALTTSQLVSSIAALLKVTGNYSLTVTGTVTEAQVVALNHNVTAHLSAGLVVSDSAATITGALTALLGLGSTVGSIVLTDTTPVLSLTAAQLVADAAVLLKITGAYGITVSGTATAAQATGANSLLTANLTSGFAVVDSAANVALALNGLQTLLSASQLASVTLNDGGTPTLTTTAASLVADAGVLAMISGAYALTVSSGTVTLAQIGALSPTVTAHLSAGLAVSDSAAAIGGGLSTLLGLGSLVASIALTGSTPVLSLTAVQLASDASVLLKIGGGYGITLSGTASVAQATGANGLLTAHLTAGFAVLDGVANVTSHLDALQVLATAGQLGSIALNDGGTPALTVTAATLVADAGALAAITGSYTLTVSSGTVTEAQVAALSPSVTVHLSAGLPVSDSAATITGALSTLLGLGSTVGSIALTDGTPVLSLTAAQLLSDASVLLKISGAYGITLSGTATAAQATGANSLLNAHLTSGFAVLDSAANVVSHLSGLQGLVTAGQIASIALNDGNTPTLTINAATLVADAGALAAITGLYTLTVSSGTVTEAQIAALSPAVTAHLSAGLAVSGSAAAIGGAMSTLLGLGSTVGSIALTDETPVLSLTAAQVVAGVAVLLKISGLYGIALTDETPVLSLTAAQLVSDASVLLKISGDYGITLSGTATAAQATGANSLLNTHLTAGFAVVDSAANVTSHLDGLQALVTASALGSIALNDGGTPVLTVTAATLVADAGALAAITGLYTLTVSSGTVTEVQVAALSPLVAAHLSAGLAVSDSASTIGGTLSTLLGLGSTVGSIALTDGTPVLSLTAAQLVSDASVLLKIGGSYGITLSGTATAAQATGANSLLTAHLTSGFAVLDSVANVTSHLDGLQGVATASHLASVALSDGGTPAMTVTAATLVADVGALAAITGSYALIVSSGTVTEAQIAALSPSVTAHLSAGLAVSDSVATIGGALSTLLGLGSTVASIALTDESPVLSLTAAQLLSDASVLLKIGGSYGITLAGTATAAQATGANSLLAAHLTSGFAVADSAAGVISHLDGLQALATASALASIALNDGGTPILTVTAATLVADAGALAAITSAYALTVSSGTVTETQIAALSPVVTGHLSAGLAVSGDAATIGGALTTLLGAGEHGRVDQPD